MDFKYRFWKKLTKRAQVNLIADVWYAAPDQLCKKMCNRVYMRGISRYKDVQIVGQSRKKNQMVKSVMLVLCSATQYCFEVFLWWLWWLMVELGCEGILDACQACLARCLEAQIFSVGTNFRSQNVETWQAFAVKLWGVRSLTCTLLLRLPPRQRTCVVSCLIPVKW